MKLQKRMQALIMAAVAGVCVWGSKASAQDNFGLGVILGDPTGISGKAKMDGSHSIDAALAYSTGRWDGLQIHADYLWDHAHSWGTTQGPLDLYYGLGGRVITGTSNSGEDNGKSVLGPRGSLGLSFNVHNPNLELFGELALVLDLIPATDVDLEAGIGVRIRF